MSDRLHILRILPLREAPARRLMDVIEGNAASPPLSVAMVRSDENDGRWIIEVLFERPPEKDAVNLWLDAVGGPQDPRPRFAMAVLAENDWVARSHRSLPPVHAGRFVIHGRHDRGRFTHHRFALEIEAAQAFGTGHHATTTDCLLAIERYLRANSPRRALDIGTGTGILAMAIAKSGTAAILASDIDPLAIELARSNARANGLANRIRFIVAAGTAHRELPRRAHDLVVANILARPLIRLAGHITRLTAPGGKIILSGLLSAQARTLAAQYRAHGAVMASRIESDGWSTLVLRKPGPGLRKTKTPARSRGLIFFRT